MIEVKKSNSRTLDSLMIPKWFLRDKSIKEFLLDLDKIYVETLTDIWNSDILKPPWTPPPRSQKTVYPSRVQQRMQN